MIKLEEDFPVEELADELADLDIILNGIASLLGINLIEARNAKMKINRARKWMITTAGHGYHIKD